MRIISLFFYKIVFGKKIEQTIKYISSPESFNLSKRELEILEKIADGISYQQIGNILFISAKTVRKHIEHIYEKLHVHSKLEAVKIGQRNDWF